MIGDRKKEKSEVKRKTRWKAVRRQKEKRKAWKRGKRGQWEKLGRGLSGVTRKDLPKQKPMFEKCALKELKQTKL